MRFACTFFLAVVLVACNTTQLPIESKVAYDPKSGSINLQLPKNSSGKELRFVQKNGAKTVLLVLKDFSFTNSPMVLDAAGAANVAAINAWGGIMNSIMAAAMAMSGKVPIAAAPMPMELTAPPFRYELSPPHSLTFTNKAVP